MVSVVCLVVLVGAGLVIVHEVTKSKTTVEPDRTSSSKGLVGAAGFTQKVYDAYLPVSAKGERAFINSHRAWFTKDFLTYGVDKQASASNPKTPFLFCSEPAQLPSGFKVAVSTLSADGKTALVYVNDKSGSKPKVVNLPVQLKAVNGAWAINTINCGLI